MSEEPQGDFGELRSLLQRAPSASVWQALCDRLSHEWSGAPWREMAEPYTMNLLQRWPIALRVLPRLWAERLLADQPLPWLACARHLNLFELRGVTLELDQVERLLHAQAWDRLGCGSILHIGYPARALLGLLEAATYLDGVRELELAHNRLEATDCERLLRSYHLGQLQLLDMAYNMLGAPGAAVIARSPYLQQLEALYVRGNHLLVEGARALADAEFEALRLLGLGGNHIQVQGLEAILARPWAAELETLYVWDNGLGDAGVGLLAERLDERAALTHLFLGANEVGDEGLQTLSAAPWLGSLRALGLSENPLGRRGLEALFAQEHLELEELELRHIESHAGLIALLLGWPGLSTVRSLGLSIAGLDADELADLLASDRLASLVELDLEACHLNGRACEALLHNEALGRLRHLRVRLRRCDTLTEEALREARPHLELEEP